MDSLAQGKATEAQATFETAMQLDPATMQNRHRNGTSLAGYNLHARALTEFLAAAYLKPEAAAPCYGVAASYAKLGKKTTAIRWYERYLEMDPTSQWAASARQELLKLRSR